VAFPTVASLPVESLDRVSVYLAPARGLTVLPDVASKPSAEVWFNPGTESVEVFDTARDLGLNPVAGCSILAVGQSPEQFPDA
jgi:predicted CoA-binding protein